jgi:acyl-CoA hydrolase
VSLPAEMATYYDLEVLSLAEKRSRCITRGCSIAMGRDLAREAGRLHLALAHRWKDGTSSLWNWAIPLLDGLPDSGAMAAMVEEATDRIRRAHDERIEASGWPWP